ncbi:MAG: hypothetical protein ACTMK5_04390, partial [Pseudomonas helleri]
VDQAYSKVFGVKTAFKCAIFCAVVKCSFVTGYSDERSMFSRSTIKRSRGKLAPAEGEILDGCGI